MADSNLNVQIGANVDGLKKGLIQAENGIKKFGKSTTQMANQTKQMGGAVRGAVPAMTSFSQVIQDAPFGIRGVANNIQQLTAQFGHLQKNAGGTKSALKAMVGALSGPAGILLAVSAVTSLLVSYGDEISNFIFGTDEAANTTERLNDALRDQIGLRKLLKDEINVATSIAVAEAKLAGKTTEEQFAVRKKFAEANVATLQGQYTEQLELYRAFQSKNQKALAKGDEDLLELKESYKKDLLDLEKNIRDAQAKITLDGLNEQIRIQEAKGKETLYAIKSSLQNIATVAVPLAGEIGNKINTALASTTPKDVIPFNDALAEQLLALKNFNDSADMIIKGSIAETFAGLGFVIGEALTGGANIIESAGTALLGGVGALLTDLGKMAISVGVGLLGIKKALATLNPVVAIAAGVALIAVGSAFSKGAASLANSFGSGGSAGSAGGTDFSSGSRSFSGGSVRSVSSNGNNGGTYVFEIQGTKLVGVLKNTISRNNALGGNLSITG